MFNVHLFCIGAFEKCALCGVLILFISIVISIRVGILILSTSIIFLYILIHVSVLILSTSIIFHYIYYKLFNIQLYFEYNKFIASNHCMRLHGAHPSHLAYPAMLPIGDLQVTLQFYHCSEPHSTSPVDLCENIFEPHTHQQICGVIQSITFFILHICREMDLLSKMVLFAKACISLNSHGTLELSSLCLKGTK